MPGIVNKVYCFQGLKDYRFRKDPNAFFLLLYQIWVHKDVCGTGTRDEPLTTYAWEAKFMTLLKIP